MRRALIGGAIALAAVVLAVFLLVPSLLPSGLLDKDGSGSTDGLSSIPKLENLSPSGGETVYGPNVTLEWTGDAHADSYSVLVTMPGSPIAAVNLTSATSHYDLDGALSDGEYQWTVQAIEDGVYGPLSEATRFTIRTALDAPTLQSPSDGSVQVNSVPTLRWGGVSDAQGYRLQIATDTGFGSIMVDIRLEGTSYSPTFVMGDETVYSWRVSAYHGEAWSAWSSVRQFSHHSFLAAPMPISPSADSVVGGDQVNLTWSAVDGASTYRVQVSTSSDFANTVVNAEVTGEWYLVPMALDEGVTYHWRVQAVNAAITSSWSAAWQLSVAQNALPFSYSWSYDGRSWSLSGSVPGSDYYHLKSLPRTYDYASYVMNDDPSVAYVASGLKSMAEGTGYGGDLAQFILAFVQNVPYTEDLKTTGQVEYPRYPAETLVDHGGDCEDKSALYASLMQCPVINVDAIMIMYTSTSSGPGHMAVGIEGSFSGTYYSDGVKDYFFCETTGVGWEIGILPPELKTGYKVDLLPC